MDFIKYFIVLCLFSFQVAFGQNKDSIPSYRLSEIVVSATKTNTPSLFLANSVSVIDSQEIAQREKISLIDLLKSEYGLSYTTQGNSGSNSYVNIRGAGTGHTLVLIDGIEMNRSTDPGNTFDFSTVTTENLDRIEILRGPQGTLYGSDALSGVINVFTKKGSEGLKLHLSSEGGSYKTYKGNAALSGGKGIFNFNINYGYITSEGFSSASENYGNTEKDGFRNSTISARTGLNLTSGLTFDLRYHFTKAFAELDWQGGYQGDHDTYISNTEETGFRGSINYKFSNLENTAGISYKRNFRKYSYGFTPVSFGPSDSRYDGNRIKYDLQSNLYLDNNTLTAGIEYEKEKMSSDYNDYSFNYFSSMPLVSNSTAGIFIQDQFRWNSLFITLGGRYDNNEIFGSTFTYRLSPAYLISDLGTKIKASYGTGFKSPSLTNLFDPMYGNKDLKPEKSKGWDAGIEQYFNRYRINSGVTYFNMDFEDLFVFNPVTQRTENVNNAASQGVEVFFSGEFIEGFKLKMNYTFTEPKEEAFGIEKISYIRKPKHKAALMFDINFLEIAYAGTEIIYTGKREDAYYSTQDFITHITTLPEYVLVNLVVSCDLFNSLKIYSRVENILDKEYEDIYGFATPGFSVYVGVKLDTGSILKW